MCSDHQDRLRLFRVAELAQRVFYLYREVNYARENFMIERVEHKPLHPEQLRHYPGSSTAKGVLEIYGAGYKDTDIVWLNGNVEVTEGDEDDVYAQSGSYEDNTENRNTFSNPIVEVGDFLAYLFEFEDDKKAALTYSSCLYAARFFVEFYNLFPPGFVRTSDAITQETKGENLLLRFRSLPPRIDTFDEYPSWRMNHTVLKVTVRSGEEYAVDLAGAQFGHFEAVVPWNSYMETRILEIVGNNPPTPYQGWLELQDYSRPMVKEYRQGLPVEFRYPEDGPCIDAVLMLFNA